MLRMLADASAVESGEVPCLRLGKQLRFRPADVAAYLDQHD